MWEKLVEQIKRHQKIILLRHIFPDYDAIGSQMALFEFIQNNFSDKDVKLGGQLPLEYQKIGHVDSLTASDFKEALVITTDTATKTRIDISNVAWLKATSLVFKIDHHVDEDKYADLQIVDASFPATCELLTKLFSDSQLQFSAKTAFYLFHGLITDTERFLYRSVSARTFKMAAILLEKGIDFQKVYQNIYQTPKNLMNLKGYLLQNFHITKNNLVYCVISKKILDQFQVIDPHTVALWVNLLGEVQNAKMWIFFVETSDHIRVEFRSSDVSVRELAQHFQGGGHKTAAGARLQRLEQYIEVINYCEQFLEKTKI